MGRGPRRFGVRRATAALLALLPVAPLLAWVYGVGPFALWCRAVTLPALVLLVALCAWARRDSADPELARLIRVGAIGGLLGTAAYDVVRIPVELTGRKVFAPIDSYGVLLMNARSSDAWTGIAGWAFHTTNGVCFGIAFAVVASRRPVPWAIAWAMILESVAVFSPFARQYGLTGKWDLIAIAYGAHVAYALPLGWAARDPVLFDRRLDEITPFAATGMLVAAGVALVLWQHPWTTPADDRAGERVAAGASAVIRGGDFHPVWLRVPAGGCATVRNDDDASHRLGDVGVVIAGGTTARVCPEGDGLHRLKLDGTPNTGGWVIVDRELAR